MRVLLTGGSGFIGRHLAHDLRAAHEVLAPSHAELELRDADVVAAYLRGTRPDAVVHTAVKPGHRNAPDTNGLLAANLAMFFNIVRARGSFGRLVVIGSGACYDAARPLDCVREEEAGVRVPADDHGLSKLVEALWLAGDEAASELRLFGVYGPGEDYSIRFVSNACCKALFDLPLTLRRDRRFSYLWVTDLAPVVEAALGGRLPGAYNVVSDEIVRLRDMADLVLETCGKDLPLEVAHSGEGLPYSGAGSKIAAALPEIRFTPPEEGVRRLYEWYGEHRGSIKRDLLLTDK